MGMQRICKKKKIVQINVILQIKATYSVASCVLFIYLVFKLKGSFGEVVSFRFPLLIVMKGRTVFSRMPKE